MYKRIQRGFSALAIILALSPGARSQGGGMIRVPDVSGIDSASQRNGVLRNLGLNPVHASAGQPRSDDTSYKVAGQSPAAGTMAPRGSTVTILIYDKYAPVHNSATLPNVVGMPWEQAISTLRGAGFEVKNARNLGKAPSADRAGRVASQSPAANQPASADRTVTVTWYDDYEGNKPALQQSTGADSGPDALIGEWVGTADFVPRASNSTDLGTLLGERKWPGETTINVAVRVARNSDGTWAVSIDSPNNPQLVHWRASGAATFTNGRLGLVQTVTRAGGTPDNFILSLALQGGKLFCSWKMPDVTEPKPQAPHGIEHFQTGRFQGVRKQ